MRSIVEYEVLLNYPENGRRPNGEVIGTSLELNAAPSGNLAGPRGRHQIRQGLGECHGVPRLPRLWCFRDCQRPGLVYANYGRPEDFDALEKLGVDVRGKIVLARYGELFRGLKVRNAQKRGAVGLLDLHSDPADERLRQGDVYPEGPFRPGSAIRAAGACSSSSLGPGDPRPSNGPSVKGAKRLPTDPQHGFPLNDKVSPSRAGDAWEKRPGLVRDDYYASIPTLPISYDAARPILEALAGDNVPTGWQGALPFAYHVGPGPAEVKFTTRMNYQIRPIWNVIAKLKGEVEPDRWVLVGNHRDAWT